MNPSRSGSWPSSISWGDDVNLEKIKMLLGISAENTSEDAVLCFILDDVRETILNYCNIEELPSGLENTACRMALDLYRYDRPGRAEGPMSVATDGGKDLHQFYAGGGCPAGRYPCGL